MTWNTATVLKLGRVSNLPTVWTNTLAGVVLAGGSLADVRMLALLLAMTLAYIGGMFLNDAFDSDIDAVERPERPIPAGDVSRASVFIVGYALLAGALVIVAGCALTADGGGLRAVFAGLALVAVIVLYNVWHKNNPLSPFLMGLCRMLVYFTAGWSLAGTTGDATPAALYVGALVLLCYLIGLTYTARQENLGEVKNLWPLLFLCAPIIYGIQASLTMPILWIPTGIMTGWIIYSLSYIRRRQKGDIPRAVVSMIAGISLIDALFIASVIGEFSWVLTAFGAFLLTLYLQRYIAGT